MFFFENKDVKHYFHVLCEGISKLSCAMSLELTRVYFHRLEGVESSFFRRSKDESSDVIGPWKIIAVCSIYSTLS